MKKASCPTCGKSIESGTLFCPHCGAAIFESELTAEQPTPQPAAQPAEQPAENPEAPLTFFQKLPMQKILPVAAVVAAAVIAVALSWDNLTGLFHPSDTTPQLSTDPSTQTTASSTNLTLPSGGSGYIPGGFISSATIPSGWTVPSGWTFPSDFPPFTITIATVPAPTETEPAPTQPDLSWHIESPQYMSYEEYFAENRPHTEVTMPSWQLPNVSARFPFMLAWRPKTNNDLVIRNANNDIIYDIPNDEAYAGYSIIGADGTYGYLADKSTNGTVIHKMNLTTGDSVAIAQHSRILQIKLYENGVLYYAAVEDGKVCIYRCYLPTERTEMIYETPVHPLSPAPWFSFSVSSTQGTISMNGISTEMIQQLYAEFSNPESPYRPAAGFASSPSTDPGRYWDNPELIQELNYSMDSVDIMMRLQKKYNLQALWKATYSLADGSYTEDLGVVDECWFGSGLPHDHWNPEKTEFIAPTVYTETPTPLSGLTAPAPEMAEQMRSETWSDSNDIFRTEQNRVKNQEGTIVGPPVAPNGSLCNTKFYSYYISDSGSIIRLSLDGTVTEIYTAQNGMLKCLSYEKGILVFIDGDTAMALDMVYCTARRLVSHPGLGWVEWDSDGTGNVYFTTILGLQVDAYLYDPVTGKLQQSSYRL